VRAIRIGNDIGEEVLRLHRGIARHTQQRDIQEPSHQFNTRGLTIGGNAAPHEVIHGTLILSGIHELFGNVDCLRRDGIIVWELRNERPLRR